MSDDPTNNKHPDSTFKAEYPYNAVTLTRGGHEIHINDTPGHESLRIGHTKGTYVEINETGALTLVCVDKVHNYYTDGHSETIDGHSDKKIAGTHNLNVDGSMNEQTKGSKYVGIGENLVTGVGGTRYDHVESDTYESIGGDVTTDVSGDTFTNVGGSAVHQVKGTKTDILSDDWAVTTAGNIEINATGSFRIKCANLIIDAGSITMKTSAGDVTVTSSGSVSVNGGAPIALKAPSISLN